MLNAFRHQRFDTDSNIIDLVNFIVCSTPFGIRDSTHFIEVCKITNLSRAQRLSASEIRHIVMLTALLTKGTMCSTPFGIRDSTPVVLTTGHGSYQSAQRLSASEIRHFPFGQDLKNTKRVLNAFRHQRFDTVSIRLKVFDSSMCSTPFGIRDSTRSENVWH